MSTTTHQKGPRKATHVVFLVNEFDGVGGIARWANSLAEDLFRRGYEVTLIGLNSASVPRDYGRPEGIRTVNCFPPDTVSRRVRDSRVRRTVARVATRLLRIEGLKRKSPVAVATLRSLLLKLDAAAVVICTHYTFMQYVAQAGLADPARREFSIIGQFHTDFDRISAVASVVREISRQYEQADLVTALTSEDAASLREIMHTEVHVFPNASPDPIDDAEALRTRRRKVFVTMGRLDPVKQYDHAIRAWESVIRSHPEWRLELHGEGPDRSRLERLISELGLDDSVSLMGPTSNPTSVLSTATAHVVTSRYEGWGLAIGEANSVGTPTISYACSPGVRTQIQHGVNGVLVAPQDISGLAAEARRLIDDPSLRSHLAVGGLRVAGDFSRDEIRGRWEAEIEDLAAARIADRDTHRNDARQEPA